MKVKKASRSGAAAQRKKKNEERKVKKDEIPYKVPKNWVWVRLLSTFTNVTSSNRKIKQKDYLNEGNYAIVDQGKELIGGYTNNKNLLYEGNLPVIVFGDHTRIVKYIDFPFAQGADGVKLFFPKNNINNKFLYYSLLNIDIPDLGYRRHYPLFSQLIIPLSPLPEQKRIVKRIESLFTKLDKARELSGAKDRIDIMKKAILARAFRGELGTNNPKEDPPFV